MIGGLSGCVDLGLNTAFDTGDVGAVSTAFTRQMRPSWLENGRVRRGWEPYPVWVDRSGCWADGPAEWRGNVYWERDVSEEGWVDGDHPTLWYAGRSACCTHLTLAANCSLPGDLNAIHFGRIYEFAKRPYRWMENEVQSAYEAVSHGDLTASDVASVAWVGDYTSGRRPTEEQLSLVRDIHEWDEDVAEYLAFGPKHIRPFCWHNADWVDEDMAEGDGRAGYSDIGTGLYDQGNMYIPYEAGQGRTGKGMGGQGFMALRRCDDGAPDSDDWRRIGAAIVQGGVIRPCQAFDLRVVKTVTLARGKWRAAGVPKELAKVYDITCWRISGAPPAEEGDTFHAI